MQKQHANPPAADAARGRVSAGPCRWVLIPLPRHITPRLDPPMPVAERSGGAMNDQFAPNNANGAAGTPVDALLAQIRDLTTTAAQLQQIAAHAPQHPELIAPLLAHPNTYPQLAQWLRGLQPQNDPSAARYIGPAVSGIGASAATTIGLATSQASGTGTAAGTDLAGAPGATATPAASQVSGVAPASAPGAPSLPPTPRRYLRPSRLPHTSTPPQRHRHSAAYLPSTQPAPPRRRRQRRAGRAPRSAPRLEASAPARSSPGSLPSCWSLAAARPATSP